LNKSVEEIIYRIKFDLEENPNHLALIVARSDLEELVSYFEDLKTFENSI